MGIKRQSAGKWQVFSETGVGAGYKLNTYTPGTTDNKLTYTNKDGSANNANPVIFDSRGEADIWFDGTYDLRLVDANDTLIWTLSDFGAGEGQVNYGNYNLVNDGGFEDDTNGDNLPDQWDVTAYPTAGAGAGVVVIDTTDQIEGAQSLKFTSVGDGGGYAVSNFFEAREGGQVAAIWMMKSTDAAVRNVVEVIWYTAAQVQISTSSLYDDSATNPTGWTQKSGVATAVTNARYAKLRIYGCHSSDATTGDTWFDDVRAVSDTVFGDLTIVNDMTVGNDLTVSGDLNAAGTLSILGVQVTATSAEINILDGATLDVTELNYVDGVTSSIQTQIDSKAGNGANSDITSITGLTTDLAVIHGGTGSSTASGARSNLGLGTLATLSSVAQAQIDADSVGQSEIKETNQDVSVAVSGGVIDTLLTSPQHNFFSYYLRASSANGTASDAGLIVISAGAVNATFVPRAYIRIGEDTGIAKTMYGRTYYINSSPPYYSNDGQILLFTFGIVDNTTGKLLALASSIDPPWMYNGSTNTVADAKGENGEYYIKKRLLEVEIPNWREMQVNGSLSNRKMISRRLKTDEFTYIEVDQTIKNADMNEIPHPFENNDLTGKTVVYLDPVSKVTEDLYNHHILAKTNASAPSALELIHDGYITIGTDDLNRDKPSGLKCVSLKWKNNA